MKTIKRITKKPLTTKKELFLLKNFLKDLEDEVEDLTCAHESLDNRSNAIYEDLLKRFSILDKLFADHLYNKSHNPQLLEDEVKRQIQLEMNKYEFGFKKVK